MLSLLIVCFFAGAIGAILQGMVGVGTGIIIIPLLTFILPHYGISPEFSIHVALGTSMAVIVVNSISALISHYKRGNVQWSIFKKIIVYSLIGSIAGAWAASILASSYLESIFGIFMLLLAAYMIFKKEIANEIETLPHFSHKVLSVSGLIIGFVASIIGTGGGVLMIPFLHSCKMKMRHAVGTSTLIGLPVAFMGSLTYILTGLSKVPASPALIGYMHWPAFLAISISGMLCAPLGARMATILPAKILKQTFAFCMVVVGIKMLI